jgi:hypothetical protein
VRYRFSSTRDTQSVFYISVGAPNLFWYNAVASIADQVIALFNWSNASSNTIVLGSTASNRNEHLDSSWR